MLGEALNKKSEEINIPVMLETQIARMLPFWCDSSLSFDLYNSSLARLATKDILPQLAPHWIEISIEEELARLDENHVLEVSVPILNLCDLLPNSYFSGPPLAAKVVGFNGFAAKGNHRLIENFPLADFVLVTDIAGNQYELLINKEGKIELPNEGIGLFSIPSQITFIFSEKQVKRGIGLDNYQAQGLEKNKIYIYPPDHACQNFSMHISVSHLNSLNKRIVDTIRKIGVEYQETMVHHKQATTQINRHNQQLPNAFCVEMDLSFDRLIDFPFPYALNVTVESTDNAKFGLTDHKRPELPNETRGWMQHPIFPQVFTKYFGLSAKTLTALSKKVYTQYDLIRDYLEGDDFGFSRQRGYNDFLLRPEAFERFYSMIMDELVYQRLPKNFLQERVTTDKLIALNDHQLSVDFHDSIVLSGLQSEIIEGRFNHFYDLFSRSENLKEFLYLYETGNATTPTITVDIVPQVRLSTYVAPLDEQPGARHQPITKDYQSSTALNSAYLAARIRHDTLSDLASEKVNYPQTNLTEDPPILPNSDAKTPENWYNTPPRSR